MVCTGYLAAWLTDLYGFRQRSLVERLFWSVPLSVAISTIGSVLIGRFLSLGAAAALVIASLIGCIAVFALEWFQLRASSRKWIVGLQPVGTTILVLSLVWIAFEVLSVVDFQSHQRLYMSLTFYDIGARTNWANSVLRTGIPPANPNYFYLHSANLRYYYFWMADCAVVGKILHLPMRSIINASCIWSGLCLEALTGLYLKHFLSVGTRLRRQFLIAALLPAVGGFSVCIYFWNMLVLHIPPPGEVWAAGQIADFVSFFFFYPHHLVSMVCCIFALLLAWMGAAGGSRDRIVSVLFIALALASAFGLSVYVTFAFFLVMLCWAVWQVVFKRTGRAPLLLFGGGLIAGILLVPYLHEITHAQSGMYGASPFTWSVRETIPPDRLAHLWPMWAMAATHPQAVREFAKLILLLPGFALELGLYFLVLVIFLVPAWRRRNPLSAAQQTLVFIAVCALPVTSLIRSAVLDVNDFGIHSALFMQYPLLLLASELFILWRIEGPKSPAGDPVPASTDHAPRRLRSLVTLAVIIGALSTAWQATVLRFLLPIASIAANQAKNPHVAALPHKAYISYIGYSELNSRIPADAIVQFNPDDSWTFWKNIDTVNINRQVSISWSQPWCGAELGGDRSACPTMISTIAPLFTDATAHQARATCETYRIQYLVVNIYDPVWKNQNSWVWTLNPVVADPEFRAIACR